MLHELYIEAASLIFAWPKDSFEIHLVSYSEHSNYDELRQYVKFLKPKKVIPTVGMNIDKLDSKQADKLEKCFAGFVDEMASKKEFLRCFHPQLHENDATEIISDSNIQGKLESGNSKDSSQIEAPEIVDVCVCSENSSCPQVVPSEQNSSVLTDEAKEKIFLELRDCLPNWVTKEQMLDLFSSSDRNIVDAVSNFYERETQFCRQVSASAPEVFLTNVSASPLKPAHSEYECDKTLTDLLTKTGKSPNLKFSTNCSISLGKRKKATSSKANKKAEGPVKFDSGGPKQSMITRYFNKLLPGSSQDMVIVPRTKECSKNENVSACNTTDAYINEIDQFIQITGCRGTSRSQAAAILLKTKGDICKALDVYYSNSEGHPTDDFDKADLEITIQVQNNVSDSNKEKSLAEESGHTFSSSMQETGSFGINLVSLHPDKYKPIEHACWTRGESAPYIHLARTFDMIEGEKGKIKATSMLCNMFRSLLALSPEDVLPSVYLCTNKIAADHENTELNIGGSLVSSALEEACGVPRSKLRDMYNKFGDLGDVAQLCRQTQKLLVPPSPLSIRDVFSTLQKISVQTGNGSTMRKKDLILSLIRSAREKEMKFLVRTLVRNLRIGAMIRTILPALAQAVVMNSSLGLHVEGTTYNLKEKLQFVSAEVVEAYNILPNLDSILPVLIEKGVKFSSSALSMSPGVPIKPMLAKITHGIPEVLKCFENKAFTCEYKYDGQRAQIHKLVGGEVRIFSRNGDETTSKFPDLVDTVKKSCKPDVQTFILDAEVVAVDRKNGCKLMSFQELSSRERGSKNSSISVECVKIGVCIYAFDIMFANGKQVLSCPLSQRRKYLRDLFHEKSGYFEYARETTVEANDACLTCEATFTRINYFLEDALHSSCEGIMVKSLDVNAGYFPSKRSDLWLKVKQDYVEGLNDSLDLVPIGAWHGNGRKAGWYSPFLMACYDPENEEFQSVCRVMSGFSDAFYMEMKAFFSGGKILPKKPSYYRTGEVPDVWFSAELVWEIRGADLTVSPIHEAARGLVHLSRGISIRFPRFIGGVMDRNPEDCSTAADVAERFLSQTLKMDVRVGLGD